MLCFQVRQFYQIRAVVGKRGIFLHFSSFFYYFLPFSNFLPHYGPPTPSEWLAQPEGLGYATGCLFQNMSLQCSVWTLGRLAEASYRLFYLTRFLFLNTPQPIINTMIPVKTNPEYSNWPFISEIIKIGEKICSFATQKRICRAIYFILDSLSAQVNVSNTIKKKRKKNKNK